MPVVLLGPDDHHRRGIAPVLPTQRVGPQKSAFLSVVAKWWKCSERAIRTTGCSTCSPTTELHGRADIAPAGAAGRIERDASGPPQPPGRPCSGFRLRGGRPRRVLVEPRISNLYVLFHHRQSIPQTTTTTAPPVPSLTSVAWKVAVEGAVYAQPVVVGSRVFVATEDDDVYALSLDTGKVLWHASVGTPLTDVVEYAGCGDIDPLGITSTPVADTANDTLYVVGEISNGADPPSVHRELVGFDMATGKVVRTADADPTGGGDSQINLLQRPGLVIDDGRVNVGFGGLFGDCGYYHGWVVGVSIAPGVANIEFDTTAGGSGGAVWQGGAPPSVDPAGDLYVVTGNENPQGTAGYYESVIKLSPTLVPEASFRDTAATGDEDFGTSTPLLLPNGTLFAVGKTDIGYVLEQSDLSLVASIPGVCGSNPDGRMRVRRGHRRRLRAVPGWRHPGGGPGHRQPRLEGGHREQQSPPSRRLPVGALLPGRHPPSPEPGNRRGRAVHRHRPGGEFRHPGLRRRPPVGGECHRDGGGV